MKATPWVLATLLLAGCAASPIAIRVENLAGAHQYAPSPFVEVMMTPPDQPYTKVARLRVTAGAALDSAQVIEALRQRAADLGANALIVQRQSSQEIPGISINPSGGQYGFNNNSGEEIYIGTAIHVVNVDNSKKGELSR